MADATVLMVGTRKGLWVGRSDEAREEWSWQGPEFQGEEVYSAMADTRGSAPRLLAGSQSMWFGPLVRRSDDLGRTWEETPGGSPAFPDDIDEAVVNTWQLQPGVGDDVVWAGTQPGAIFKSEDRGETFALVRGLWDHPHREQWQAGFGGQAFHTLLPHPTDPDSLVAAISTGGVYATEDGGATWEPRNQGVRVDFDPGGEPTFPEFGQCVHKVHRHPSRPERMYLQNHGGVYRSDDQGRSWTAIHDGLPSDFGFPVLVHPHQPDTIYVFPIAGYARHPVDGDAAVYRSRDAGESWERLENGLPSSFYVGVMRDGMAADDHARAGLYVGARNGAVYVSTDDGDSWREVVRDLPDVVVVRAAAL